MNYTRTYVYDELSRPTETDVKINDQPPYIQKTSYDQDSRPDEITYVNGLKVKNIYNSLSYLTQIINSDTKASYQTVNSMDAQGHVTSITHSNGLITLNTYDPRNGFLTDINTGLSTSLEIQKKMFPAFTAVDQVLNKINDQKAKIIDETNKKTVESTDHAKNNFNKINGLENSNAQIQGSHYIYDSLGNIKERDDKIVNRTETFNYDDLNRLTQNTDSLSGTTNYQYDDIGNLTYKSDIGNYTYGENGAGPHAVTSISGALPSTFIYDKNGDQILGTLGKERRKMIYTSYNKPLDIITDDAEVQFLYNADRDRFVRVDKVGKKTTTTLYIGGSELVSTDDGTGVTNEYKNYIGSTLYIEKHSPALQKTEDRGQKTEKNVFDLNGNEVTVNLYTLLTDNLGSVVAITDEQANITQRFYYTPFGEQKQIDGKTLDAPLTHKGFTGHEEVECVNLIHMSGRMYDPRIGRFLSADPFVQDYENPQTLNRYSYCLNNPITFTDPSGYWSLSDFFDSICDIFKNLFSANGLTNLLGLAIAALSIANPLLSAALLAVYSGVATVAQGGNLESALFAMGTSFATSLVWMATGAALEGMKCGVGAMADKWLERTLVHGLVGGGIQAAEGGSFKDGFLSAAVSEAVSCKFSTPLNEKESNYKFVERTAAAYIIGGTASAVTGGNFQNGAMTAAYAQLYNEIADEINKEAKQLLTVDEGKPIENEAATWEETKYAKAGTEYAGPNAVNHEGGDCSGINHAVYKATGHDYPYQTAGEFAKTSGGGHFAKVDVPQLGDTVSWKGHLGIYAGNGQMWTTHLNSNNGQYGLSTVQSFSHDFGKNPEYYRYRKDD